MGELSLANVAAEVTAWRKTKQRRTSTYKTSKIGGIFKSIHFC